ncbi:hypothetical protein [Aureivirga marina]|uniref:hypothetical protein n=1 Tax=Aureivirga marina TaxID=1182451 RepID=UPI0018C994EC|nr:hypothetical protein [Aureivirga marina]
MSPKAQELAKLTAELKELYKELEEAERERDIMNGEHLTYTKPKKKKKKKKKKSKKEVNTIYVAKMKIV